MPCSTDCQGNWRHHSSVCCIIRQDVQLECVKKQELTLADCVSRPTVAEKASAECIFFFDKVSLIIPLVNLYAIRQLAGEHWCKSSRATHQSIPHVRQSSSCTRKLKISFGWSCGHRLVQTQIPFIIKFELHAYTCCVYNCLKML